MTNINLEKKQVLARYNLSTYGLNELIKEGLPHYTIGKITYFPKLELENWMELQQSRINKLMYDETINNNRLSKIFKCSTQGGMRRSHKTSTLVLVAKRNNEIYTDSWKQNILHYTGMGQVGDQKLNGNQNITLFESNTNNVNLHLFEVHKANEYIYKGKVELAGNPYQTTENDINNNKRSVWKFPLRLIGK